MIFLHLLPQPVPICIRYRITESLDQYLNSVESIIPHLNVSSLQLAISTAKSTFGHPSFSQGLSWLLQYILSYIIVLVMDLNFPRISRPLTETQQIQNMLNLGDISEITPEPSEEAQRHIRKLELDLQQALRDVEVKEKQIENLKKTQKHLENHQELQRKKIATLEERIKAQESDIRKFRDSQSTVLEINDAAMLEVRLKEVTEDIAKLKKENSRLSKQASRDQEIVSEQERELERYKEENEDLVIKIKENQAKFNQKIAELERKYKNQKPQVKTEIRTEVKTQVIVDTKQIERLQTLNERQRLELTQAKTETSALKKQVAEVEKRLKIDENEMNESKKTKESLRQKIKDLENVIRRLRDSKQQADPKQASSEQPLQVENNAANLGQQEEEMCSPEEKSVKKSLASVIKQPLLSSQAKIRLLNTIIANAENELDILTAQLS